MADDEEPTAAPGGDDAPMVVDEELLPEAAHLEALELRDPPAAMAAYAAIVAAASDATAAAPLAADAAARAELAFHRLAALYAGHGRAAELRALVGAVQRFLPAVSKAKGSKLFRAVLDAFVAMAGDLDDKVALLRECIAWAVDQKRRFLRQALEIRVCALLLALGRHEAVLTAVAPLVKELKKLDDKGQLVEVQLMESRAFFALSNYPKSRGALVSARTTAAGIYCPPALQAGLDLQSGVLHAQERDYKTAYSYFYEAFEGFDALAQAPQNQTQQQPQSAAAPPPDAQARRALKYMLLCKVMLETPGEVTALLGGKLAARHAGRALDSMAAVGAACVARSLAAFEQARVDFADEIAGDAVVAAHLQELYDSLLQLNLAAIVEPYARVDLAHVAGKIGLPPALVEAKLSQMILDAKLHGILDQGVGCLELFEDAAKDSTFESAVAALGHMGKVVDALQKKAQKLV